MPDLLKEFPAPDDDLTRPRDWREICRRCNELRLEPGSWWQRVVSDPEAVPRVDESSLTVRLRGNALAEVQLRGESLQCRIAPEHLLLSHPGSRAVLGDASAASASRRVQSLAELAQHYDHVRRRVCRTTDRHGAILDRLFLRHPCILAVDASLPCGKADLVTLSPNGVVVIFLLRRYASGDLRLKGRGGIAWRMAELDNWLAETQVATSWVRGLLERSAALDTRHSRRYRAPDTLHIHRRARLLIVDFDHAQRLGGLPSLRADLETGLDRTRSKDDIPCIGDPGNISYAILFSGL
jgi:hypothetical protein